MQKSLICLLIIFSFCLAGCAQKKPITTKEFTLGLVQKEIRKGMSQADVAEALGSPNIVTKDSNEKETWIYDKIASEATYSHKNSYWTLILFGGGTETGRSSFSQKTLTVVIKFTENGRVETLSYHSSKF